MLTPYAISCLSIKELRKEIRLKKGVVGNRANARWYLEGYLLELLGLPRNQVGIIKRPRKYVSPVVPIPLRALVAPDVQVIEPDVQVIVPVVSVIVPDMQVLDDVDAAYVNVFGFSPRFSGLSSRARWE